MVPNDENAIIFKDQQSCRKFYQKKKKKQSCCKNMMVLLIVLPLGLLVTVSGVLLIV
jgi:hypothetical protein